MKLFRLLQLGAFGGLFAALSGFATAQVQVAFDPCRPAQGEPAPSSNFQSLCPEDLLGGGVIVRGASADTHALLADRMALDSLLAFSGQNLKALEDDLRASNLYTQISIVPSTGLVEVQLTEIPRIAGVEFIGNAAFTAGQLQEFAPLTAGAALAQNQVIDYAREIISQYQQAGYFSVALEPFLVPDTSYAFANGVKVQFEIQEGNVAPISPIKFVGNTTLTNAELLDLIREAKTWKTADQIDIEALNTDQNNILKAYAEEGMGLTSLSIQIATYDADGQKLTGDQAPASVGLVFEINERSFTIGKVTVVGDEDEDKAIHQAAASQTSELISGETFDPESALKEAEALAQRLNQAGDLVVGVNPVFEVDPETSAMNISFVVFTLPARKLISVQFVGNEQTAEGYMLRIMRIQVGKSLTNADVQEAVNALAATGLFEDISISEGSASEDQLALIVTVTENKTGLQRLGATYSTKTGFSMRMGVEERNWLGRGLFAGTSANFGESSQSLEFFLTPPPFRLSDEIKIQNQFKFTATNNSTDDYRSNALSWTARYNRTLGAHITETPSLTLSSNQITHAGSEASDSIKADHGVLKTQAALGYALSRSVLKSNDLPLDGTNYRLSGTLTFPVTEDMHGRISAQSAAYRSLDKAERAVVSWRNSLDLVDAIGSGTLPSGARLTNTTVAVRGFESGGFAPREADNDSLYGGTTAFGSSLSLRYKLLNHDRLPIYASIYLDAGTIFDVGSDFTYDSNGTDVSVHDSNLLRVSSGYGIVLQTDAGAITFTLSEIHAKADFDKVEELQFGFGVNL